LSENPFTEPNLHRFTAMTLTAKLNQKAKAILIRELGPSLSRLASNPTFH
jgi:hypothetical protein